jgi:hypothetical protein
MEYITGIYALNTHHTENNDEPTGDWHGAIWEGIMELPDPRVSYGGAGHLIDTMDIWGDFGIFDDTEKFYRMGITVKNGRVYIADYYRALLDLLYYGLSAYEDIINLNGATEDWFDTAWQKELIIEMIRKERWRFTEKARGKLDDWIDKEIRYEEIRARHDPE